MLTIYGPFKDPTEYPMLESLAMRPVEGPHMRSSRLCAGCHTVFLPVLDEQGQVIDSKYEQATYHRVAQQQLSRRRKCGPVVPGLPHARLVRRPAAEVQDRQHSGSGLPDHVLSGSAARHHGRAQGRLPPSCADGDQHLRPRILPPLPRHPGGAHQELHDRLRHRPAAGDQQRLRRGCEPQRPEWISSTSSEAATRSRPASR